MSELDTVVKTLKTNDGLYREASLYRLAYLLHHGLKPIKCETLDDVNAHWCKVYFYFEYSSELGKLLQAYKWSTYDQYNSMINHVFLNVKSGTPEIILTNLSMIAKKNTY